MVYLIEADGIDTDVREELCHLGFYVEMEQKFENSKTSITLVKLVNQR